MAGINTPWLRLWTDMPNDPKWRTIARVSKQSIPAVIAVFIHLLVSASNATERGRTQNVCSEDIASALDLECEQVDAIMAAMQGRVLDGDHVSAWEKRQVFREDGAAERAKAWRETKKQQKNTVSNENRTQPNATERSEQKTNATERPEERREEKRRGDKDTQTARVAGGADFEIGEDPGLPKTDFPEFKPSMAAAVCIAIKSSGVASVNPSHPDLALLLEQGADIGQFAAAARVASEKGKGFAYVLGIVRGQLSDAQSAAGKAVSAVAAGVIVPTETAHQRMVRERAEQFAPGIAIRPSTPQNITQPYTVEENHGASIVPI